LGYFHYHEKQITGEAKGWQEERWYRTDMVIKKKGNSNLLLEHYLNLSHSLKQ
jgi:hypothetical protein